MPLVVYFKRILSFAVVDYSKESRMNGQYQQPTDSLNNDNKYVGLWGTWG
jgi:hypothetical protein